MKRNFLECVDIDIEIEWSGIILFYWWKSCKMFKKILICKSYVPPQGRHGAAGGCCWAPKQLARADLCLAESGAHKSELACPPSSPSQLGERFNKSDWASAPGRLGKLWSEGETSLGPFLGLEEDQMQKRVLNHDLLPANICNPTLKENVSNGITGLSSTSFV